MSTHPVRYDESGRNFSALESFTNRYAYFCAALVVATIFAARPIPATYDDLNYLAYFSGVSTINDTNWWSWLIEEPLWRIGTLILGSTFGAETAYRIVIFSSTAMLFLGTYLCLGRTSWIIFLLFVVDMNFSTGLYSLAIRQGLATSVFIMLFSLGVGPLLAIAVASSIHTGLAIFLPAAVVVQLLPQRNLLLSISIGTATAVAILILSLTDVIHLAVSEADLGRRSETYSDPHELTIFYYVGFLVQYVFVLFINRPPSEKSQYFRLYVFVVVATACSLVFVIENGAFARIVMSLNVMMCIYLSATIREKQGRRAAAIWTAAVIFASVNESLKAQNFVDTWAGGWSIVLGLN